MASDVELAFKRLHDHAEWGKQAQARATISMAFGIEQLLAVAEAALAEHASHFDRYADDEEGCATCFYLNKLKDFQ
jgi:hypothetical protein